MGVEDEPVFRAHLTGLTPGPVSASLIVRSSMSGFDMNFTTISSLALAIVGAVSLALAMALWIGSTRIGQMRLRLVSAGFFVLFVKSVFIILTIHALGLDHESIQTIDALFDLTAVLLVASPFLFRKT
jgi:hypothetical protein